MLRATPVRAPVRTGSSAQIVASLRRRDHRGDGSKTMDITRYARSAFTDDLLDLLLDASAPPEERAEAAVALAGIPEDIKSAYRREQMARCEDPAVFAAVERFAAAAGIRLRRWAVRALVWLGRYPATVASLRVMAALLDGSADDETRYDLIRLFGRSGFPEAVPLLERYLKKRDPATSSRIFSALAQHGHASAIDVLVAHRRHDAAWRALATIADARAVEAAFAVAKGRPHSDVWGLLLSSARAIGRDDVVRACEDAIARLERDYPPR
jgi:hypothetical protein